MSTFAEFGKESRSIKPPIPEEEGAFAAFGIPEKSWWQKTKELAGRIFPAVPPPEAPPPRELSPREAALGGQLVPVELAPAHKVGSFASPEAFQRPETTIEEGAGVEQGPSPQIPLEAPPQAPAGPPKGPLGRARDLLGRELIVPPYEPVRYPSAPPITMTPGKEEFLSAREEPEGPVEAEMQPLATFGKALKKPKELSEKDRARASNILALSQETNLPPNVIEKNYDVITKQLGIRGTPTSGELVSKIMEWAIGAGLAARPISTVVGILSYMGWKEAESLAVQKIKGEEAKLGAGREMKEFLPPLKEPFESAVEAAEFLIPASLAGGTVKAVRSFRQGWQEGKAWAARQAEEEARAKAGRKALPPSPEEVIEAETVEPRKELPEPAKQLPPAPPEAEAGAFAEFEKPPGKPPAKAPKKVKPSPASVPEKEEPKGKEPVAPPAPEFLQEGTPRPPAPSPVPEVSEEAPKPPTEVPPSRSVKAPVEKPTPKPGDFVQFTDESGKLQRGKIRDYDATKKEVWIFPEDKSLVKDKVSATVQVPLDRIAPMKGEAKMLNPEAPPENPPDRAFFAVRDKTGRVFYDPTVEVHHEQVRENAGIPADQVKDVGWVYNGSYWTDQGELTKEMFRVANETQTIKPETKPPEPETKPAVPETKAPLGETKPKAPELPKRPEVEGIQYDRIMDIQNLATGEAKTTLSSAMGMLERDQDELAHQQLESAHTQLMRTQPQLADALRDVIDKSFPPEKPKVEVKEEKPPLARKEEPKEKYPVFISPEGKEYKTILHAVDIRRTGPSTLGGTGWEWYGFEKEGKDVYFGFVHGDFDEFGSFSVAELRELGIPITTDPKALQEIMPPVGWKKKEVRETPPKVSAKLLEEEKGKIPETQIADKVVDYLKTKKIVDANTLFKWADEAYGGTQAQGKYTPKDAYDAMELGVNKRIADSLVTDPNLDPELAKDQVSALKSMMAKFPTESKRTEELQKFQQFSTPPPLAYVANWVAKIRKEDVYLEPSAGIGGLAVFGKNAGAKEVIVNELSPRRAKILGELGFDRVFQENAEQLNNVLPKDVQPSVIVMNPPFSQTAGRMGTKMETQTGANHVEQALKRPCPPSVFGKATIVQEKIRIM